MIRYISDGSAIREAAFPNASALGSVLPSPLRAAALNTLAISWASLYSFFLGWISRKHQYKTEKVIHQRFSLEVAFAVDNIRNGDS
ncbi:hypothetical protein MUK42_24838 [Musa troglodytarum]|uniref:Uncharacterized protein n=1 Tax=Musa troglodytarum TaxID=320322 RepID=A0A9E7IAR2_9LILI|nr:hypothetical protein MUK42_24838 [Musa troglodytarum]